MGGKRKGQTCEAHPMKPTRLPEWRGDAKVPEPVLPGEGVSLSPRAVGSW